MSVQAKPREWRRGMSRKWAFFRTFVRGRPVWCSWQITDRCNFRCRFCSAWKRHGKEREQTLQEIETSAANLARLGTMVVSMTGGEPFVRQDLPEIVRALALHHFPFVSTNGWLVTEERARALVEAGLWGIGVSLDYADAARHDRNRGQEGAHARAIEALRILQAARIRGRPQVNLMCTLMHDNLEDLHALAELAREIGCRMRIQPYSVLKTGDTSLRHPPPVADRLLELRREVPSVATSPVVLEKFDLALADGVPGCVAGRYMLNIDPYGRVAKCPEDQANPVGHILRDDAESLLRGLRDRHRANTCRACWYNCRNEVEVTYSLRGLFHSGMSNFRGR